MFHFKKNKLKSRRFLVHIFISLLLTGIVPVILLGGFTTLFSTKIIEDTYREQSEKKMELLINSMNLSINSKREMLLRMSKDPTVRNAIFTNESRNREDLSSLYNKLYSEIKGNIDDVSLHLVNDYGKNYSTHVLPEFYNPNHEEQILTTYLKLKYNRETFPIVNPFISPKGDRVAISLFQLLSSDSYYKGFLIVDINSRALRESLEKINTSFFSDIYLIDSITHKYINLLKDDASGNFTKLQNQIPEGKSGIIRSEGILINYSPLYSRDLMLVGTISYDTVNANMSVLTKIILIISVAGIIISSIVAYALAKNITRPVTTLTGAMKQLEQGDFTFQVENFSDNEFVTLFSGFNRMSKQINTLLDARIEREQALRTAERLALQSQINPHFLYNTLNTIKAISKLNNVPEITTIITELGKLLRNSIDQQEEFTSVEDSLQLVEAYLKIQKIRYGDSFNWSIIRDDELGLRRIPRLIIQPIVENSVIHGLESLTGEKNIIIKCLTNPDIIKVIDNGSGMSQERWDEAISGNISVGLKNVYKRLKLYYGDKSGLSYEKDENQTTINIHL